MVLSICLTLRCVHVGHRGAQRRRALRGACWALVAAAALAGCGQGATSHQTSSSTSTTAPGIGHILKPSSVRTAHIYVPPGRSATKGPIGVNPSLEAGLPLNILAGLERDEPIYDGDFADPTALPAGNTLYFYASSSQASRYDHGANVPVIALSRGVSLATPCRRCPPGPCRGISGRRTCGRARTART
jgi:hypothetical protein